MRILALVTDAFGGHGGIAQYNRHFLTGLCEMPDCEEVVALPRLVLKQEETLPARLAWQREGLGGKVQYFLALLRLLTTDRRYDVIYCGHINLLPIAAFARRLTGGRLVLQIHGIDAWRPTRSALANRLVERVDLCLAVSRISRRRFLGWANLAPDKCRVLPNTIPNSVFGPGPKNAELVTRYGLHGKKVLMTLGRLVSEERYKGFDEVLNALPALTSGIPNLVYLIAGDGNDRPRLEKRAGDLSIADRVIFTGPVSESEKPDHYRLADIYVMPSMGEGFGIVLLEALASGLAVIASAEDGGRDALREGRYGTLIKPGDSGSMVAAIREHLSGGLKGQGPDTFAYRHFSKALSNVMRPSS